MANPREIIELKAYTVTLADIIAAAKDNRLAMQAKGGYLVRATLPDTFVPPPVIYDIATDSVRQITQAEVDTLIKRAAEAALKRGA